MKGIINRGGYLLRKYNYPPGHRSYKTGGYYEVEFLCPFSGEEINACGDWCPLSSGLKNSLVNPVTKDTELLLCDGRMVFEELTDLREYE